MKYSKRQIEVWKARERLSEKLARMTPEEITAHAKEVAADWERKIAAKRTRTPKKPHRRKGLADVRTRP